MACMAFAPIEDTVLYFVRSIPLFIALPITQSFDSLNMWRLASILIALRWFCAKETIARLLTQLREFAKKPAIYLYAHRFFFSVTILFGIAILSLGVAGDKIAGIRRLVYFVNLSAIGVVVYDLLLRGRITLKKIIPPIAIATLIATIGGFVQLISTYFIDIYAFMRFWGERVQLNLFGAQWAEIAVWHGNTWFAYFGDQLSLRMFSLFPDSHSFPIFILLGLCAIVGLAFKNFSTTWHQTVRHNISWYLVSIPLVLLASILSGTRGIWAASVGVALWIPCAHFILKHWRASTDKKKILRQLSGLVVLFFLLFGIAYPIFASKQFKVPKDGSDEIIRRIRSIVDLGETSNSARLAIWKASFDSIIKHPILGVGIYNFPVVLNEKIITSKAGASAHNIYLHMAAEMGIPGLLATLAVLLFITERILRNFIDSRTPEATAYFGAAILFVPWIFLYSLTDFALFDERAFLMFVITLALIFGYKKADA